MQPARDGLSEFIRTVTLSTPHKAVVANVTGRPFSTTDDIRRLLVEQVTSPVKWAQTMAYLKDAGVTRVVEIGPGKVLTGMAKREMQLEQTVNLDTLEDIRTFATVTV
jgi:[acyl-carrier-protein] S-malonyltransferase